MTPLPITSYTATTALGSGLAANWAGLEAGLGGLRPCAFAGSQALATWVGEVAGLEQVALPPRLTAFDCRNNRLAWLGLQQDGFMAAVAAAVARYGAGRVACYIGTSTAGIHQTELAYMALDPETGALPADYRYETTHNTYSIGEFVRQALELAGISGVVSTACSSSAKVFAAASRSIAAGLCDAAVVGGVDSLCLTTLYGFNALQLVSAQPCRPCDIARDGISIGEAAGFALLERSSRQAAPALLGYGESSDAYHMSSPHPQGAGAELAMRAALATAGLAPGAIGYVNLHGTATPANDLAEARAVARVLGAAPPCSSTKGWTGHTLGAAGIVEAVLSLLCLERGLAPRSLNTGERDPALEINVLLEHRTLSQQTVLSNSFGFGGSNCSLVLGGVQRW